MFRSASLRLAALYTGGFVAAVLTLGVITILTTRTALTSQFDRRILSESAALAQEFRTEGLNGVSQAVEERDRTPGALDFGLVSPDGRPLAGRLASAAAPLGWSELKIGGTPAEREKIRVYATQFAGGYRLLVGGDDEHIEALDQLLAKRFLLAILGIVVIGLIGGYGLNRGMGRQIAAITGAAEAIIDGDLSRRVPARGSSDDLDHLSATFNRMLDRIQALVDSLRQVTNDVAHDLRTPLTRLRARLESRIAGVPQGADPTIEAALADLDAILETFAALLRIAHIEAGARRAAFRRADLTAIGRTVAEAFIPSAEDAGQSLIFEGNQPMVVEGDTELLTQMVVNLVENALRHAGHGAAVRVKATRGGRAVVLSVIDDGPGVPASERARLFDRFYRLERDRSTPGTGLGLALVAAIAKLHGAAITLGDGNPGLVVRVSFTAASG